MAVYRFDPTPGNLEMVATMETPPFITTAVATAPEDGLYVVMNDGMFRKYDRAGTRMQQIDTGLASPSFMITDPTTGLVALGGENGAVIVDPSTESVQLVTVAAVVSVGFA
jgi:hypothetical protein